MDCFEVGLEQGAEAGVLLVAEAGQVFRHRRFRDTANIDAEGGHGVEAGQLEDHDLLWIGDDGSGAAGVLDVELGLGQGRECGQGEQGANGRQEAAPDCPFVVQRIRQARPRQAFSIRLARHGPVLEDVGGPRRRQLRSIY